MIDIIQAREIVNRAFDGEVFITEPKGLYEPAEYILSMSGKKVRPALALVAASLFTDNLEDVVKPALAYEIFHNFTLVHDDIMDNANIRRGVPAVHEKWNTNTAILSGDAMSIMAYRYLVQCPDKYLRQMVELFNTTAIEVCEGQQYDMEFETRNDVSLDEYLHMIKLKTSVLIAACLKAGAILGGATDAQADLLYDFGINIGIAFQIQDDLLDVYGDAAKFGKKIGGDIEASKKTFLTLKAFEIANPIQKSDLYNFLNETDTAANIKIVRVTGIYNQLNIKEEVSTSINKYYHKALKSLEGLSADNINTESLISFASELLERES